MLSAGYEPIGKGMMKKQSRRFLLIISFGICTTLHALTEKQIAFLVATGGAIGLGASRTKCAQNVSLIGAGACMLALTGAAIEYGNIDVYAGIEQQPLYALKQYLGAAFFSGSITSAAFFAMQSSS